MEFIEPASLPGSYDLPVIGVSGHTAPAKWAIWDREVTLCPQNILDRVTAAGCLPVLLPTVPGIEQVVSQLDGLLLPGGPDVEPARYGASPHSKLDFTNPKRDAAEFALLDAALCRELPILGICRGLQVMNVSLGGTLHQYLPDILGHHEHCPKETTFGPQPVRCKPGSLAAGILGETVPPVPCHHHQAIDQLGTGLVPTGWADDGVIEAVELAGYPFAIGLQWHADEDGFDSLYLALAQAARQSRALAATAKV